MGVMWRLSFHPDLWDDADEAISYYAQADPSLPAMFLDELDSAFAFMRQYPEGMASYNGIHRRIALRRFPYLICYRVIPENATIRVLAIVQAQRDPKWISSLLAKRTSTISGNATNPERPKPRGGFIEDDWGPIDWNNNDWLAGFGES